MDAKEEVKQRLSIEDVVSEYVALKRAGRNFKGLSPFTSEKTPSFIVSPEKQIWHDFSSAKGGDVFSFVMEMEGLDFKGALELLARKAGVELEQYQARGTNSKLKARLHEALDLAAKFYQTQFKSSKEALNYVIKTRKFNRQTALDFRIGYAPNTGDALSKFMQKKGFTRKELEQAGLISRNAYGSDMFRNRLMIPLMDAQGQVIGFTARLLEDNDKAPKYINTPQTMLYDKSRHVFGLHLAKEAMRKEKFTVVVEGNLDVLASHQAGVKNVVATAGTALTVQHLKTIGRFSDDVRLSFDADRAGLAATERSIPIASSVGVSLSIITLKGGKDPDELIRQDAQAWQKAINSKQYAIDWLIEKYAGQLDLSSGQGKRAFSDALLTTLKNLSDPVEQDHYLVEVAKMINVSPSALKEKLASKNETKRLKKRTSTDVESDKHQLEWAKAQDHFLAMVLMRPALRELLDIVDSDMVPQESAKTLLDHLHAHPDFDGDLSKAPLLQNITDYVKILSLQYEALFLGLDEVEGSYEAHRLRARLIELFVKTKKTQLAAALQSAGDEDAHKLLTRVKSLDNLLKLSQGKGTDAKEA
jgi:DNA primase